MEFTTATDYDMKTLTAMAKALRKTVRKKKSRRAHIFGWIVVLLGTLLLLPQAGSSFSISGKTLLTLAAVLAILLTDVYKRQRQILRKPETLGKPEPEVVLKKSLHKRFHIQGRLIVYFLLHVPDRDDLHLSLIHISIGATGSIVPQSPTCDVLAPGYVSSALRPSRQ